MSSMGNVGSNYGMPMGMPNSAVGGVHSGPNMGAGNMGYMPSAVSPAYANPSYNGQVSPAHSNPSYKGQISPAHANPSFKGHVSPAYANPCGKEHVAPVHVKGAAATGGYNMAGTVLVLYILLVIILRCTWI